MHNNTPAGWVVQVTTAGQPSPTQSPSNRFSVAVGPPSFKYFNVAIAAAEAAIAATTKYLADPERPETIVVRALSLREIAALGLADGDVKSA